MKNLPRLVIAGTHSGAGKTTLSTAIMAALNRAGYRVQPYKTGPDYIDPGYHTAATGRISRNLDSFFLGEDGVREMFFRSAAEADLSIIEGVMGLYDGLGATDWGSTAHVAKIIKAPVLLVVDARSMARSAAAMVLGYKMLDRDVNLCGVILNRVGSRRHYLLLKESIENLAGLPVMGYVSRQAGLSLPERHLGLLPSSEKEGLSEHLELLASQVTEGIDLDLLAGVARQAESFHIPDFSMSESKAFPQKQADFIARIGIVKDEAFTFYYQDGLDILQAMGAELVTCSVLHDASLPTDLDGIYIGGGFPEMFLERLSQNHGFREDIRRAHELDMPIYAECGGLMYLTRSIIDFSGREYPMVGLVPGKCRMEKRRAALGYVYADVIKENIIAPAGTRLRGHEFHYSTLLMEDESHGEACQAYVISKQGENGRPEGYARGNLLASYLHLHFAGCPQAARSFVEACARFRECRLSGKVDF